MKEINYLTNQRLKLCLDSIALLLYCGNLVGSNEYSICEKEWINLEKKIKHSQIKHPSGLLSLGLEAIMINLDIKEELARRLIQLNKLLPNLLQQLLYLERSGVNILTKYDYEYPSCFKTKLKKQPPLIIYYCGDLSLLNQEMVLISGTIKSNKRINQNIKKIDYKISNENYAIITCNNGEIESMAIKSHLKNEGKVISFIGGNIIQEIKNYTKYIKHGQMLLLSHCCPIAPFKSGKLNDVYYFSFLLSKAVIMMHSQINCGDIWLTAMQNCIEKWTTLVAIMDDEFYGNARLVEYGAIPLTMDMIDLDLPFFELLKQNKTTAIQDQYDQLSIYEFIGE